MVTAFVREPPNLNCWTELSHNVRIENNNRLPVLCPRCYSNVVETARDVYSNWRAVVVSARQWCARDVDTPRAPILGHDWCGGGQGYRGNYGGDTTID